MHRLLRLIADINSVLGLLQRVLLGDVADVSEEHAAFILCLNE
jgi:hypothetical protein